MVIIFTHPDADGICCAALMKMTPRHTETKVFFSHPAGLARDLVQFDEDIFICDIALDPSSFPQICDQLSRILEKHRVVHLDHHLIPGKLPEGIELAHDETISATEVVFRYFYHELPKNADHLALIGSICEYMDDTPLISRLMIRYERRTLFMDAGILAQGLKAYTRKPQYDELRKIINQMALGGHPSDINRLTDAALRITRKDKFRRNRINLIYKTARHIAWVIDPRIGSRSKIAHWILGDSGKMLGMSIRTIDSRRHLVDISIRGQIINDIRTLITPIAIEMGGSAGGHENAVGVRIPDTKLRDFLIRVDDEIEKLHLPNPIPLETLIPLKNADMD